MSDDPYRWPVWPEPIHVLILRRKVEAVEALALKHKLHGDGRIPVCQILNAFLLIDEECRP